MRITEVCPEAGSADGAESNGFDAQFFCDINSERHDAVTNNASDGRAVRVVTNGENEVSEVRGHNGVHVERFGQVGEVARGAWVVVGGTVGDGLEAEETGEAGEAGLDVGELEEAFVVVVGVEEGDLDAGKAEELS
ncbi:hypothetical protein Sjap_013406 [Stephania japonica]|uniref:Uncharacterized protein n=1 Tax=Stephania japonica TaxID=461633 RepID=A0AAP0NZ37_9MAGN